MSRRKKKRDGFAAAPEESENTRGPEEAEEFEISASGEVVESFAGDGEPAESGTLAALRAELHDKLIALELQVEERLLFLEGAFAAEKELLHAGGSADDPPSIDFALDALLKAMVKHGATDLHVKPGSRPAARLDGDMIPVGTASLTAADTRKLVFESMPEKALERFYRKGGTSFALSAHGARFRVSACRSRGEVSAAIRMLSASPSLSALNLPPALEKWAGMGHGLILASGPAGSGRSTTLAALVDGINAARKKHIVTIEDPIEYLHADKESFVAQREIGVDAPSFFEALSQAVREDPDVILLGELPDAETIWEAASAAAQGRLVLSVVPAAGAAQAIERLLDSFAGERRERFRLLLSRTLRGVISQRLLTRREGRGRVPAAEVLAVTPAVSRLIAEGNLQEIYPCIVQGEREGMQSMTESIAKLYRAGLIDQETAQYHADQSGDSDGAEKRAAGVERLDWSVTA